MNWIFIISVALFLLFFGIALQAWISLLRDKRIARKYEKFSRDISAAIEHGKPAPTWEQIKAMGKKSGIEERVAHNILQGLLDELIKDPKHRLRKSRNLIESYIYEYKQFEPFEGLPYRVRVDLVNLRSVLPGNERLLEPVVLDIRALVDEFERDKITKEIFTAWGFVIGVVSMLFAIYTYFNPYSSE